MLQSIASIVQLKIIALQAIV